MAVKKVKVLKQFTHGEKVGEFSNARVHKVGEIVEIDLTPEIEAVLVKGGHIHVILKDSDWSDARIKAEMNEESVRQESMGPSGKHDHSTPKR